MHAALGKEALLHPLHAILLGFPIALFTGALVSDVTYLNSAQIQWSNFSAWLNAGGLLVGVIVLVWAVVATARTRGTARRRAAIYLVLVVALMIVGLVNAFQHSRDGWSSVGTGGLVLSIVSMLLAWAAGWVGHADWRAPGEPR